MEHRRIPRFPELPTTLQGEDKIERRSDFPRNKKDKYSSVARHLEGLIDLYRSLKFRPMLFMCRTLSVVEKIGIENEIQVHPGGGTPEITVTVG